MKEWSSEKIQHALNEMVARYGAPFVTKPDLRRTFQRDLPGYQPDESVSPDALPESKFTKTEKANWDMMVRVRNARKTVGKPSN